MRQLTAFFKKEYMEAMRGGKFPVLVIVFLLFGIMNPAMAKLTPWIMETVSDSLAKTGLTVTEVEVDAMTSWTQYYKNIPVAVLVFVFVLMFGGILTAEYQKGTLINMLGKGMKRWKILVSKLTFLLICWTFVYWLCYGITYGYNAWFWDNAVAKHVWFAASCIYVAGIWLITLLILLSVPAGTASVAVLCVGGVCGALYAAGMWPEIKQYLPIKLFEAFSLLSGEGIVSEYQSAVTVALFVSVIHVIAAVLLFNKKSVV